MGQNTSSNENRLLNILDQLAARIENAPKKMKYKKEWISIIGK